MIVYSVRDVKAEYFGTPFFMHNDALAKRAFGDLAKDPQSTISKNPEDFQLYRVGEWIDNEGSLIQEEIPQLIMTATEIPHAAPEPKIQNIAP